jgi:alkylhydroperoxidase family enzyme
VSWITSETRSSTDRQVIGALQPQAFTALEEVVVAAWSMTDTDLLDLCVGRMSELLGYRDRPARSETTAKLKQWNLGALTSELDGSALAYTEQFVVAPGNVTDADNSELQRHVGPAGLFNFVHALNILEGYLRLSVLLELRSQLLAAPPVRSAAEPVPHTTDVRPPTDPSAREAYKDLVLDPTFLEARIAFTKAVHRLGEVDPLMSEIVRLRNAQHQQCQFCSSFRRSVPLPTNVPDLSLAVARFEQSALGDKSKVMLRLIDALLTVPSDLPEQLRTDSLANFSGTAILEALLKVTSLSQDKSRIALRFDGPFSPGQLTSFVYDQEGVFVIDADMPEPAAMALPR